MTTTLNQFFKSLFSFHLTSFDYADAIYAPYINLKSTTQQQLVLSNILDDVNYFMAFNEGSFLTKDNKVNINFVTFVTPNSFNVFENNDSLNFYNYLNFNQSLVSNFSFVAYVDENEISLIQEQVKTTFIIEEDSINLFNFELIFLFIQGTLLYVSLFFTKIHIYLILLILEMLILVIVLGFLLIDLTNSFAISIAIIIISLAACETALGLSILINRTKYEE